MTKDYCSALQWQLAKDESRSPAQASAAVSKVRTKCHRVYALFENLIVLQAEARVALEAAATDEQLMAAIAIVNEARLTLKNAERLAAELRDQEDQ